MSDVYYHAIIIPKRDIDRLTISHVYFPRETIWEVKKGRSVAKEVFSHESTFDGVYCVVGYYLPESEVLLNGSGRKVAKVLTAEGPQSLGGSAWRIHVPDFHIDFAKSREANSRNNPFKPTQFKRGDLVQSNEWFLIGKTFRVTYCKPHVTTAREINSGHLFSLRTLNLSLIK